MKNEGREGGKGGFVDQMVMSRDWCGRGEAGVVIYHVAVGLMMR